MQFTTVVPYLMLTPAFLGVAQLILWRSPFCQSSVQRSEQTVHTTLDGLRGFLALGVFFVHANCHYNWLTTGQWTPGSPFYIFLGKAAVWCFFIITGFLFWSKFIPAYVANESLQAKSTFTLSRQSLPKFYQARFFRVFPLYAFSFSLILIIVLLQSNFRWQMPPLDSVGAITEWLSCQIFRLPIIRGFSEFPSLNSTDTWKINGGVAWTLAYEVSFYLLLPLLAWFAPFSRFVGLAIVILGLNLWLPRHYQLFSVVPTEIFLTFLVGMAIAYLYQRVRLESICRQSWMAAIALILIIIAAWGIMTEQMDIFMQVGYIGLAFTIILYGNNLGGLLVSRPARLLGTISYGIYLLHGIALYLVIRGIDTVYPLNNLPIVGFWVIAAICGTIVIALSCLTYRYIEYPCLSKKSKLRV